MHRSKVLQYDPSRDSVQVNGELVVIEPTGFSPAKKKKKKKKSKHKITSMSPLCSSTCNL
jgi:hypothetical protein